MPPLLREHYKLLRLVAKAEATQARGTGYFEGWTLLSHGNVIKEMKSQGGWPPLVNLARGLAEHGLLEFREGEGRFVRLTKKGQAFLSQSPPVSYPPQFTTGPQMHSPSTSSIKIFISHSTNDVQLASKFVKLLTASLQVRKTEIRCTSVPGCKLPSGSHSSQQILGEIRETPVFIGLLTGDSVNSAYVLFELGARWATGAKTIPLLGPGADYSLIPGPLKEKHALKTTKRPDILQLIGELETDLGIRAESPVTYEDELAELLSHEPQAVPPNQEVQQAPPPATSANLNLDRETFKRLLSLLPAKGSISFIRRNNFAGFSFQTDALSDLDNFYHSCEDPAFEFINPELEKLRSNIFASTGRFLELIATETFPTSNVKYNSVPQEWEFSQPKRFSRVVDAIHAATEEICTQYDQLVKLGRRSLGVSGSD